jgi:hypothetical protein
MLCNLIKQAVCTPLDVISAGLSFIAVILAVSIPFRIMVNQLYSDLVRDYRSTEMGAAVLAVFHFFVYDCKNDVSNIHGEYIKKYNEQIRNHPFEKIDFSRTLHFQRRLLSQFYTDMAELYWGHKFFDLSKRKLKNWFTPSEVKLLGILLYMVNPAKEVFVQADDITEPPDDDTPMNRLLKRLYDTVEDMGVL